jgi:flagellar biosynthesis protein FliR
MPLPDPTTFLLVLARVAGLVVAAPVLGHTLVPVRIRAGLAALVALALTPAVGTVPEPATLWGLAAALAVESAIGVVLGFVAQLVLSGAELGGQIAGIQMGFGMASVFDPQSRATVTVVGQLQQLFALATFLVLDVHHLLLRALLDSFRTAPPGGVALSGLGLRGAVALSGGVFAIGVRIAAPVMVVLLLANAAMGVLARTIPQLNVFVVGFPVNVGVGLMALGVSLPFTVRLLGVRFAALEPTLATLVQRLAHG